VEREERLTVSDLRTGIAAALEHHKTDPYSDWECECGSTGTKWHEHVADVLTREVLTPERLADILVAAVQKAANDGVNP
jgi:hypothetical protein